MATIRRCNRSRHPPCAVVGSRGNTAVHDVGLRGTMCGPRQFVPSIDHSARRFGSDIRDPVQGSGYGRGAAFPLQSLSSSQGLPHLARPPIGGRTPSAYGAGSSSLYKGPNFLAPATTPAPAPAPSLRAPPMVLRCSGFDRHPSRRGMSDLPVQEEFTGPIERSIP
jgi:hypothetical protein